jgi:diguanylate cyclase (GGDEF)-like protein
VRLEETLGATHDVDQLLEVVAETAVEATGAAGGLVLGTGGQLVQVGDPDSGPERLELPLSAGRHSFGKLVLVGPGFSGDERETAASLCGHAVIALENARLHRIVERQARVDGLTGLANRRHLGEALEAELGRADRFGTPVALALVDLDDFKAINDRYGHPVGDTVLCEVAETLASTVREIDLAGRWGGEEFGLVLPGTDLSGAAEVAERVRRAVAARTILTADGTPLHVTASLGVAAFPDAASARSLVAAADAALYRAKRAGKDRVVTSAVPLSRP